MTGDFIVGFVAGMLFACAVVLIALFLEWRSKRK